MGCACQARHPCSACPCPTAAMPMCLPSSSTTASVPSLPSPPRFCVCFFFPCASSFPCFSPSQLLLLSNLCSIPAHPLCAAMTAESTGSCMVWQQAQPRELWHHLGTAAPPMLPLSPKKLLWRLLLPLLWLGRFMDVLHHWEHQVAECSVCILFPEELTHFWLQEGRGCSVSLALLSLCLSLIFDV